MGTKTSEEFTVRTERKQLSTSNEGQIELIKFKKGRGNVSRQDYQPLRTPPKTFPDKISVENRNKFVKYTKPDKQDYDDYQYDVPHTLVLQIRNGKNPYALKKNKNNIEDSNIPNLSQKRRRIQNKNSSETKPTKTKDNSI